MSIENESNLNPGEAASAETQQEFKIEERLSEIASIVNKLENDELPLEDALKEFEKGVKLIRETDESLSKVKARLEVLG